MIRRNSIEDYTLGQKVGLDESQTHPAELIRDYVVRADGIITAVNKSYSDFVDVCISDGTDWLLLAEEIYPVIKVSN